MAKYFDKPTQVKFDDGEDGACGIAFEDYIICACCGGIFEIDEVNIIKTFTPWINFDEKIDE